jgi:hypothetical protein
MALDLHGRPRARGCPSITRCHGQKEEFDATAAIARIDDHLGRTVELIVHKWTRAASKY